MYFNYLLWRQLLFYGLRFQTEAEIVTSAWYVAHKYVSTTALISTERAKVCTITYSQRRYKYIIGFAAVLSGNTCRIRD